MTAPRNPCPRCGRGTTKKKLAELSSCQGCYDTWHRESFDQFMARVPRSAEILIRDLRRAGQDWVRVAAACKRKVKMKPLAAGTVAREWTTYLALLVDNARTARDIARRQKKRDAA